MADADAGLAQVVKPSPGEIPDHVGVALDDLPQAGDLGGVGLAAHHNAVGVQPVLQLMAGGQVVVAHHIHAGFRRFQAVRQNLADRELVQHLLLGRAHDLVQLLTARVGGGRQLFLRLRIHSGEQRQIVGHSQESVHAEGGVAGRVQTAQLFSQRTALGGARHPADLRHLVADAVQNHAGMVKIFVHHGLDIRAPVSGKIQCAVVGVLGLIPIIRQFVHNEHPHLVADIQ